MTKRAWTRFIAPIVIAIVIIFGYLESLKFATDSGSALDPAFYPKIIIYLTLLLVVILVIVETINIKKNTNKPRDDEKKIIDYSINLKREIIITSKFIILVILYLILLKYFGFLLTTPLLLACAMVLLNYRNITGILTVSIVSTVVIYLGFTYLLNVRFPAGIFL